MIYIPALWDDENNENRCNDKLSKTGGTMIGPIDMGDNKITGLNNDYPPADDEACRWSHIKEYTKNAPVLIQNPEKASEVKVDGTGLHVKNGNISVNMQHGGGGPEIEIRQLHHNSDTSLPGGIRLISHDRQHHFQLGLSQDGTLTLYSVDYAEGLAKQVCKFTDLRITDIERPIHPKDAANKQYVDSIKPVISVWAASGNHLDINRQTWSFGVRGRGSGPCTYPILTNSRITHGSIAIVYPEGANIVDPDEDIVEILLDGEVTDYKISTAIKRYATPLELNAGDVISFKTIKSLRILYATVNILIQLDI